MADARVQKFVGIPSHHSGKSVNVYSSYAYALAHASTGLSTIKEVAKLTGAAGDTITQVAKTTGVEIDENGYVHFVTDNGTAVYMKIEGSFTPIQVPTGEMIAV